MVPFVGQAHFDRRDSDLSWRGEHHCLTRAERGDDAHRYVVRILGEGFAEDIIVELARNSELTVLARNTSFTAKGQGRTAQDIARLFHVRYLLDGSVRHSGKQLVINAELIDGQDGRNARQPRRGTARR